MSWICPFNNKGKCKRRDNRACKQFDKGCVLTEIAIQIEKGPADKKDKKKD